MNNKKYLDPLIEVLKIKSVSTQDECLPEMKRAREFLVKTFRGMGFETKILKGKKHDAVFAQKIESKTLPTVLIYGHYDVQPEDPIDEWKTPPFKPTIKNGKIYARGAADNKGQLIAQVTAVKKLLEKTDKLQTNFKFLIEGEEEIGSISVAELVRKYAENLLKCDLLVVSDSGMIKRGLPSIDISLRGLVYVELFLETSSRNLHSGEFGGVAPNPANLLSLIISKLKDSKGKVLIPGFYKDIISPTKKELKDYRALEPSPSELIKEGGLFALAGEQKYLLNERRWARPTLDVNGLTSGYQGAGSKTIIPSKASAKISMRLVPDQDPDKIYRLFTMFVKKLVPKGTKVTFLKHSDALPYKAPTNNPVFDLAQNTLKKVFGKKPVFTGVGGSIGFIPVLAGALKVPCLMVGLGVPGDCQHGPNEFILLENYFKGIEAFSDFYQNLSGLKFSKKI